MILQLSNFTIHKFRARNIKNKAKINSKLSEAQLKALLEKTQKQLNSWRNYADSLEAEVAQWRSGKVPSEDDYVHRVDGDASVKQNTNLTSSAASLSEEEWIRKMNNYEEELRQSVTMIFT